MAFYITISSTIELVGVIIWNLRSVHYPHTSQSVWMSQPVSQSRSNLLFDQSRNESVINDIFEWSQKILYTWPRSHNIHPMMLPSRYESSVRCTKVLMVPQHSNFVIVFPYYGKYTLIIDFIQSWFLFEFNKIEKNPVFLLFWTSKNRSYVATKKPLPCDVSL